MRESHKGGAELHPDEMINQHKKRSGNWEGRGEGVIRNSQTKTLQGGDILLKSRARKKKE